MSVPLPPVPGYEAHCRSRWRWCGRTPRSSPRPRRRSGAASGPDRAAARRASARTPRSRPSPPDRHPRRRRAARGRRCCGSRDSGRGWFRRKRCRRARRRAASGERRERRIPAWLRCPGVEMRQACTARRRQSTTHRPTPASAEPMDCRCRANDGGASTPAAVDCRDKRPAFCPPLTPEAVRLHHPAAVRPRRRALHSATNRIHR